MAYLIRVHLEDRPGSLGQLAVALGSIDADILSLDVVERGNGYAVDDILLDYPTSRMADAIITAAEAVPGVRVTSLRPFVGVLDTHGELELVDDVAKAAPRDRLDVLVEGAPAVLRVAWALVIAGGDAGPDGTTPVTCLAAGSGAPETLPHTVDWLPIKGAAALAGDAPWVPGSWRDIDTDLAAAAIGRGGRALLLGRPGGPEFRPSEIARLAHLAGIISTVLR